MNSEARSYSSLHNTNEINSEARRYSSLHNAGNINSEARSYSLSSLTSCGNKLDEMFRSFLIAPETRERMFVRLVARLFAAGLLCEEDNKLIRDNLRFLVCEGFVHALKDYVAEGGSLTDVAACLRMYSLLAKKDVPSVVYPMRDSYSSSFIFLSRRDIKNSVAEECGQINDEVSLRAISARMIQLYNEVFFRGSLPRTLTEVSKKLVTSAAQHSCERTDEIVLWNKITVSSHVLLGIQKTARQRVGGIYAEGIEEILQLVLEHEICHMIVHLSESYVEGHRDNNKAMTSHGKFFKQVIYSFFRHTDCSHTLLDEKAPDVIVGQTVKFVANKKEKVGQVTKLNRRTARVESLGEKWNVAYSLLY